jgi:hypothetical protein
MEHFMQLYNDDRIDLIYHGPPSECVQNKTITTTRPDGSTQTVEMSIETSVMTHVVDIPSGVLEDPSPEFTAFYNRAFWPTQ